jgi:hypothetical protein
VSRDDGRGGRAGGERSADQTPGSDKGGAAAVDRHAEARRLAGEDDVTWTGEGHWDARISVPSAIRHPAKSDRRRAITALANLPPPVASVNVVENADGLAVAAVPFAWDRRVLVDRDNGPAVDDDCPSRFALAASMCNG